MKRFASEDFYRQEVQLKRARKSTKAQETKIFGLLLHGEKSLEF